MDDDFKLIERFICLLLVAVTALGVYGSSGFSSDWMNAEKVEMGEKSDKGEEKKESSESDLEYEPAILNSVFHKNPFINSLLSNQMMTRFPVPEFEVISPPPELS